MSRRTARSSAVSGTAAPGGGAGSVSSSSGARLAERRSRRIQSRQRFRAIRYSHDENFDWPLNALMPRNARRKVSWQTSRASSSRPRTRNASAKIDRSQRTINWLKLSESPAVASATSSSSVLCMAAAAARVALIVSHPLERLDAARPEKVCGRDAPFSARNRGPNTAGRSPSTPLRPWPSTAVGGSRGL